MEESNTLEEREWSEESKDQKDPATKSENTSPPAGNSRHLQSSSGGGSSINKPPKPSSKSKRETGVGKVQSESNIQKVNSGKLEDDENLRADEELRKTLRQPPKVSSKLPSAFSVNAKATNTKAKKLAAKNYKNMKVERVGAREKGEERAPHAHSGHHLQVNKSEALNREHSGKIGGHHHSQGKETKGDAIETYDLPNFMDVKEFNKKLKEENLNLRKHKSHSPGKVDLKTHSTVRLEDLITLSILKDSHLSGSVKKMLHAPSLKLFAVKEIPLNNRESRQKLKDWVGLWQRSVNNCPGVINIYGTFWNIPEGCVSIVTDYMNAGSLSNLLNSAGALPEYALRELAIQLLAILEKFHTKSGGAHGSLIPTQILLNQKAKILLNMGVGEHIIRGQTNKENMPSHLGEIMSLYDSNENKTLERIKSEVIESSKDKKKEDIFELGYLLLTSATGGMDIIDTEEFNSLIPLAPGNSPSTDPPPCCLLHYSQPSPSPRDPPTISDFFSSPRFSPQFLSFLCSALSLKNAVSLQSLRAHPWLHTHTPKAPNPKGPGDHQMNTPRVSVRELIHIGSHWKSGVLPLPGGYLGINQRQLDHLCDALEVVLPSCQGFERAVQTFVRHKGDPSMAGELAYDMQLDVNYVWKRIMGVVMLIQRKPLSREGNGDNKGEEGGGDNRDNRDNRDNKDNRDNRDNKGEGPPHKKDTAHQLELRLLIR